MNIKTAKTPFFFTIIFLLPFLLSVLDLWAGVNVFQISVQTEKYENGRLIRTPVSGQIRLAEDTYGKFVNHVKGEDAGIFVTADLTPFQMFRRKDEESENLAKARMDITVRPRLTEEGLINLKGILERYDFTDWDEREKPAYRYTWEIIDYSFYKEEKKELTLYDDGEGTVYLLKLKAGLVGESEELDRCLIITMDYRPKRLDTGEQICQVNNSVCVLPNTEKEEFFSWGCAAKLSPEAEEYKKLAFDFEGTITADLLSADQVKVKLKLKRDLAFPYKDNDGKIVLRSYDIVKEFVLIRNEPVEIQLPDVPQNFPFQTDESLILTYKGETTRK